jgi:MFS family permease
MNAMWLSLCVTLSLQAMIAVLQMAVPVLGPVLTATAGVEPERIGILSSLTFAGSLWFFAVSARLLPPVGAYRALLIGNLTAAVGMLLFLAGFWEAMLLGALLIGVGYGSTPPAGSQILGRVTPTAKRGLVFSIKQSGVPIGAAVAGVTLPWVSTHFGWRIAVIMIALMMLIVVVGVARLGKTLEDPGQRASMPRLSELISPRILIAPFRALKLGPALPPLTYAGATFAIVQGSIFAFLVTYLVNDPGVTLREAGIAFAAMQASGAVARVFMGWLADRIGSGLKTLMCLAGASAGMAVALSVIGQDWPLWAVNAVCGVAGFFVASWNGVYLAEIARAVPSADIATATAGSTFFTFIGYIVGPIGFGALVVATGGYDIPFITIGVSVMTASVALWWAGRASS